MMRVKKVILLIMAILMSISALFCMNSCSIFNNSGLYGTWQLSSATGSNDTLADYVSGLHNPTIIMTLLSDGTGSLRLSGGSDTLTYSTKGDYIEMTVFSEARTGNFKITGGNLTITWDNGGTWKFSKMRQNQSQEDSDPKAETQKSKVKLYASWAVCDNPLEDFHYPLERTKIILNYEAEYLILYSDGTGYLTRTGASDKAITFSHFGNRITITLFNEASQKLSGTYSLFVYENHDYLKIVPDNGDELCFSLVKAWD